VAARDVLARFQSWNDDKSWHRYGEEERRTINRGIITRSKDYGGT
jgi:hypothetical protein